MSRKIAKRYARALFHAARDRGTLAEVSQEMGALATMYRTDADFRDMMLTPVGDYLGKIASIDKLSDRVSELSRDLCRLIIEKRREETLPDIQEEFETLRKEHEGIAEAHVVSATELSEQQRGAVIAYLERKSGLRVTATFLVDPDVIGGVKVMLGETLMDGSIQGSFEGLRERLFRDVLIQA